MSYVKNQETSMQQDETYRSYIYTMHIVSLNSKMPDFCSNIMTRFVMIIHGSPMVQHWQSRNPCVPTSTGFDPLQFGFQDDLMYMCLDQAMCHMQWTLRRMRKSAIKGNININQRGTKDSRTQTICFHNNSMETSCLQRKNKSGTHMMRAVFSCCGASRQHHPHHHIAHS